jgi:hypothetical protein
MIIRTVILVAVAFIVCSCQSAAEKSQFHKGWSVESYGAAAR